MPIDDGLKNAIEYQIKTLALVGADGTAVNLIEIMRELNLFEDLFSNTMTGSLFLSDTQNLINILPIIGVEHLIVSLTKPSTPWAIDKTFRVYKITDRRKASAFSEDYILHFCSEEAVLNESLKISKSYTNMPVSDIVHDIAINQLKIDPKKFPPDALTSTTGNFDITVPYWSPFYTINWLSRMARTSSDPGCSFVFFEDGAGYHFTSIESLSQANPLQSINFMPMNFHGEQHEASDTQIRHESGESYELGNAPDLLKSLSTGLYAGQLIRVNPLTQRIDISVVDGSDLFDKADHLNENMFMQLDVDRTRKSRTNQYNSFFRVVADNLSAETWVLQRNAYLSGIHGFQVRVVMPGNMNMRVGQVVEMNLPAATVGTSEQKPIDMLYSGKYLITAIRHKVDRVKYVCILELSKDSITQPLPVPSESNSTIDKVRRA